MFAWPEEQGVGYQMLTLAAAPEPSLKRGANGVPPGPTLWCAIHFHQPGLGILQLEPAELEP